MTTAAAAPLIHPDRLPALTSLRFLAAAMIVVGHAHPRFGSFGIANVIPLQQGVAFFFVLSGFILCYNYPCFTRMAAASRFLVARLARIWPGHVAALLLFLCVMPRNGWSPAGPPTFPTLLVANLLLVQSWVPARDFILSLNGVAWSISVELFFYLCFPLLVYYRRFWAWHLAACAALVVLTIAAVAQNAVPLDAGTPGVTAFGLLYTNPLVRLLEFLTGILTARLFMAARAPTGPRWHGLVMETAILAATGTILRLIPIMGSRLGGTGLGGAAGVWLMDEGGFPLFAVLILVMARAAGPIARALSARPLVFLGEISFAVYLLHQTLLIGLDRWGGGLQRLPIAVQCALFWAMLLGGATVLHLGIERPARRLIIAAWRRSPETPGTHGRAGTLAGAANVLD